MARLLAVLCRARSAAWTRSRPDRRHEVGGNAGSGGAGHGAGPVLSLRDLASHSTAIMTDQKTSSKTARATHPHAVRRGRGARRSHARGDHPHGRSRRFEFARPVQDRSRLDQRATRTIAHRTAFIEMLQDCRPLPVVKRADRVTRAKAVSDSPTRRPSARGTDLDPTWIAHLDQKPSPEGTAPMSEIPPPSPFIHSTHRVRYAPGAIAELGALWPRNSAAGASPWSWTRTFCGGAVEARDRRDRSKPRQAQSSTACRNRSRTPISSRRCVLFLTEADPDLIIAVGGGSAMDAAKVSAHAPQQHRGRSRTSSAPSGSR